MPRKKTAEPDLSKCPEDAKPAEGSLRVWHIPQVPGKPFYVPIDRAQPLPITRAMEILKILAQYDLFQYENKIKPDYANAQGLEVYEDGEWMEWNNEDGGDIADLMRERSHD